MTIPRRVGQYDAFWFAAGEAPLGAVDAVQQQVAQLTPPGAPPPDTVVAIPADGFNWSPLMTPVTVTPRNGGTQAVQANKNRKYLLIQNNGTTPMLVCFGTNTINLSAPGTVLNIPPNGGYFEAAVKAPNSSIWVGNADATHTVQGFILEGS